VVNPRHCGHSDNAVEAWVRFPVPPILFCYPIEVKGKVESWKFLVRAMPFLCAGSRAVPRDVYKYFSLLLFLSLFLHTSSKAAIALLKIPPVINYGVRFVLCFRSWELELVARRYYVL
jgi:hypothetical protein